jgi:hypothetical protein
VVQRLSKHNLNFHTIVIFKSFLKQSSAAAAAAAADDDDATVHTEPWPLPRLLSVGPDPVSFVSNF